AWGVPAPFLLNAVSNLGVIGVLAWWREPTRAVSKLPPEHFANAMITGLRHARYNRHLTAILIRTACFFVFAQLVLGVAPAGGATAGCGGALLYGALLGAIG